MILNDYLLGLIPAGLKGVIRGNIFNNIVKNVIINFNLDNKRYDIYFEKQCKICVMTEIPDWYIHEIDTNKIIIGIFMK